MHEDKKIRVEKKILDVFTINSKVNLPMYTNRKSKNLSLSIGPSNLKSNCPTEKSSYCGLVDVCQYGIHYVNVAY